MMMPMMMMMMMMMYGIGRKNEENEKRLRYLTEYTKGEGVGIAQQPPGGTGESGRREVCAL